MEFCGYAVFTFFLVVDGGSRLGNGRSYHHIRLLSDKQAIEPAVADFAYSFAHCIGGASVDLSSGADARGKG